MDRPEAAAVLGVDPDSGPTAVRTAYRRLLHHHHPDHGDAASRPDAGRHLTTARIIEAYAVLSTPIADRRSPDRRAEGAPAPANESPTGAADRPTGTGGPRGPATHAGGGLSWSLVVDHDTLVLGIPGDEAFLVVLDAAHDIGDVTYVDPDAGLLEAIVRFEGTPTCSLVVSLQGRADRTEAWCTIESLDGRPAPAIGDVAALLGHLISARMQPPSRSDGARRPT